MNSGKSRVNVKKRKEVKQEPKLFCPQCGSDQVTLTSELMWMANTMEHYCNSVKAHDGDAKSTCLASDCEWSGLHQELKGYGEDEEQGSENAAT